MTRTQVEPNVIPPPQALDAERSVLAAMLLGADTPALTARDFYRDSHGKLFTAIVALRERGEPADLVTVAHELERRGELEAVGGPFALSQILEYATTTANLATHARIVQETAVRRETGRAADRLADALRSGSAGTQEALERFDGEREKATAGLADQRTAAEALAGKALAGPEFMTLAHPPLHCVIGEGLLPAGEFGLLVGATGVGKTFLADQLAHAVAAGEPFLGLIPTQASRVLYLSLEVQSRWLQTRRGTRFPLSHPNLRTLCLDDIGRPINLLDPADEALLIGVLTTLYTQLVFIDPLQEAHDAEENNVTWHQLIRCLKRVSLATGCAVVGIHHEGYEDTRGKPKRDLDSARGGSRLPGGAKLFMRLKPDQGGYLLTVPKTSFARRQSSIFLRQTEDGWLEPADSPDQVKDKNVGRVLGVLKTAAGGSLSNREVVAAVGLSSATVRRHLATLFEGGKVGMVGSGSSTRWFIKPDESAHPLTPAQQDAWAGESNDEA